MTSDSVRKVLSLVEELDALAAGSAFSGVVRVDVAGSVLLARAYGDAHRGWRIPNTPDTRFGIASGTKGLTALTVLCLVEDGLLNLATPVRTLLAQDLPLIDDRVTVEHLLCHRSGIGDYLDESAVEVDDYVMPVPVHELDSSTDYLKIMDGHPAAFEPGERFVYCNSGYVVLAVVAERVSGKPFHELVVERVCEPAGMRDTEFLRSDALPGRTALGYLAAGDDLRTNVLHLPVRGSGDGGIYTTVADVRRLWQALFAGEVLPLARVVDLRQPRGETGERLRYGLGFWIDAASQTIELHGSDAGVSFRSVHDPSTDTTHTVVSNTSAGAWPVARALDQIRLTRDGGTP